MAGDDVELVSSEPLGFDSVVLLVEAAAELLMSDTVVAVVGLVAAGGGGRWLSLDNVAATCCTMLVISSVVNERVSFPGELLSAVTGVSRWVLTGKTHRHCGLRFNDGINPHEGKSGI